jgi:SMC interacting uncharacterized protein involved in chromosome segregation
MRKLFNVLALTAIIVFCSCGKKTQPAPENIANDSVEAVNKQLNDFIDIVATSMDSISSQEGYIFKGDGDRPVTSKARIKQNLALYKQLLDRQKTRIADLEKQLSNNTAKDDARTKKLRSIIASLNKQIEDKDAEIAKLQKDLDSKNVDIENLKTNVESLNSNVTTLTQKNTEQEAAIKEKTDQMNTVYVRVGTRKELKDAGLTIKAGLFSKKRVNMDNVVAANFTKADKRDFKTLKINGSKPKVLTQMPVGSYRIDTDGTGTSTLVVVNPAKFWSISDYLIVQSR